jgi:hypothetical protein
MLIALGTVVLGRLHERKVQNKLEDYADVGALTRKLKKLEKKLSMWNEQGCHFTGTDLTKQDTKDILCPQDPKGQFEELQECEMQMAEQDHTKHSSHWCLGEDFTENSHYGRTCLYSNICYDPSKDTFTYHLPPNLTYPKDNATVWDKTKKPKIKNLKGQCIPEVSLGPLQFAGHQIEVLILELISRLTPNF